MKCFLFSSGTDAQPAGHRQIRVAARVVQWLLLFGLALALRVAASCGPLAIERTGDLVRVTWPGSSCKLQATSSLNNAPIQWTDVAGATSPLTVNPGQGKRFFRTVSVVDGTCSPNIVGYAVLFLPEGQNRLIALPFNGVNNDLNTLLPLPDAAAGSAIKRYDEAKQQFGDPIVWQIGTGWTTPAGPVVINPGEAITWKGQGISSITLIGEIPQGTLSNPIPGGVQGATLYGSRASMAPVEGQLDGPELGLPLPQAGESLVVQVLTPDGTVIAKAQDGQWLTGGDTFIPLGAGFLVSRSPAANWIQVFTPSDCAGAQRPVITQQPANQIVARCQTATFSVAATSSTPVSYQWQFGNGIPISGATKPTLSLSNPSPTMAGDYSVVVTNPGGSVVSDVATLTVLPPTSATPPTSLTVCSGAPATFSTVASGPGPYAYQWTRDGVVIPGAKDSSFTINSVSAIDVGKYCVAVQGLCNEVVQCATLTLADPTQTTALQSVTTCPGGKVTFSTTAGGTGPFSYQWTRDGVVIPGAKGSTLVIDSATAADAGEYCVAVKGLCNSATQCAKLTVADMTTATPLNSLTACPGESVTFTTTAGGTGPFSYVWTREGVVIPGANDRSLVVDSVSAADAGVYCVTVKGFCNKISQCGKLTVAIPTTAKPLSSFTVCPGKSVTFDTTAGGTGPFSYQWTRDGVIIPGATENHLHVDAPKASNAGKYCVVVRGQCNQVAQCATLSVVKALAATPLESLSPCPGESVRFHTTVSGDGPFTYQWTRNGVPLDGEIQDSYAINSVVAADAGTYCVLVSDACQQVSQCATLTIQSPRFVVCPRDQLIYTRRDCAVVTFQAVVTGGCGPVTLKYSVPPGSCLSLGIHPITCIADDGLNPAVSCSFQIQVLTDPRLPLSGINFASGPSGPTDPVPIGGSATFAVEAAGLAPVTYQWLKDGAIIPRATNSTYIRSPIQVRDGGRYTVLVSDGIHAVESKPISLIPDIPLLPSGDAFAAAVGPASTHQLTGLAGSNRGSLAKGSAEPGEPAHAGFPAMASQWIQWTPVVSGVATLETYGSGMDTRLAVYRRKNPDLAIEIANLLVIRANDNDNSTAGEIASRLQFNAIGGQTYYVAIDSADSIDGDFVLSWSLEPTEQKVVLADLTQLSANLRPGSGGILGLNLVVDPASVRREITWRRSGRLVLSDILGNLVISNFAREQVGRYQATIRQFYADGSLRVTYPDPVELQLYIRNDNSDADIQATDRLSDLQRQVASRPRHGQTSVRSRGSPLSLSAGVTGQQVFRTEGATREIGEPLPGDEITATSSMWYELIAETEGMVTVDTSLSTFDTILAVYHDDVGDRDPFNGLRQIVVNDDDPSSPGVRTSRVTFCARGGDSYQVVVAGKAGATGLCAVNYSMRAFSSTQLCPPPSVTCPNQVGLRPARIGSTVTLNAAVSGRDSLQLDWYRDAIHVATTTNPELVLSNLQAGAFGTYSLKVTNDEGTATRPVQILQLMDETKPALGFVKECDGAVRFILVGNPAVTHVLEGSNDLIVWIPLWTGQPVLGSYEFIVTPAADYQAYRARTLP